MKICLLAKGSSTHTEKWAEYLHKEGNDVYVLSFLPAEIQGVKVINLNPPKFSLKIGYFTVLGRVRRVLREIKPDILHAHFASSYGLIGALSGFHPLVTSVWGSDILEFPNKSPIHKWMVSYSLGKADVITSTSKMMMEGVKKLSKKKIEIIPFGIDTKKFYPGQKSQIFTLGCTKALERVYGHEYLIRAFKRSLIKFPDMRLVLLGDGSMRQSLEELVLELHLEEKVEFMGRLNQDRVAEVVRTFHILVLPSLRESFGVSALEGSASKVALIASDIPGLRETVIRDKTGLLFRSRDVIDLSDKILRLANNSKLRERLSENGLEFVSKNFNWDTEGKKLLRLYERLSAYK